MNDDASRPQKGLTLFTLAELICSIMPLSIATAEGWKHFGLLGAIVGVLVGAPFLAMVYVYYKLHHMLPELPSESVARAFFVGIIASGICVSVLAGCLTYWVCLAIGLAPTGL